MLLSPLTQYHNHHHLYYEHHPKPWEHSLIADMHAGWGGERSGIELAGSLAGSETSNLISSIVTSKQPFYRWNSIGKNVSLSQSLFSETYWSKIQNFNLYARLPGMNFGFVV